MSDSTWTNSVAERFEADATSVRAVRRFVTRALSGADDDVADLAVLLGSELATNAVIHAQSPFVVTVRCGGEGRVRVEVSDGSTVTARRCHYSSTSGTGRGLGMVEDSAASWGVEPDAAAGGKTVWFELVPEVADPRSRAAAATRTRGPQDGADVDVDLDALLDQLGGWDDDADGLAPQASARRSPHPTA